MNVRERAAKAAEANRLSEQQRKTDLLYTDEQFRRNGYGVYDHCPLPVTETTSEPKPQSTVITKQQALELGFCFQYSRNMVNVCVYRPDGSRFYAESANEALVWIQTGEHLLAYDTAPTCDLVTRLSDNEGEVLNPTSKEVVIDPYQHLDPLHYSGWELVESPDGLIVKFDGSVITTTANLGYALTRIAQGYYLTGQHCPIAYSESPVNEFGYTELVCYPA